MGMFACEKEGCLPSTSPLSSKLVNTRFIPIVDSVVTSFSIFMIRTSTTDSNEVAQYLSSIHQY
ncbi:hypothetical protein Csa_021186 [Cucumis sativus]|uniref:Uncharacterized protein n=1 Tax=Cucumis sativus TaxID=3659 RepID=A0A0A0LHB7_CUCSA|nr:hypothetical protein Csa_021186 [Cucumis sativus]